MEEGKEIRWIINLLNESKLSNSLFKKGGGCKREFETLANLSINDKSFDSWFNLMVKKGFIEFSETKNNLKGIPTKIYILNKSKMLKYLKSFELYIKLGKIVTFVD